MQPSIVVLSGDCAGTVMVLPTNEFCIGRDEAVELTLPDPLVALRHCRIQKKADGFFLQECGKFESYRREWKIDQCRARAPARRPHSGWRYAPVNCAALTEHLLESELFGYEKGAFTGAVARKKGLIEAAAGGTLFLDEIGEMGLATQAKFLRVLETREVTLVGGTQSIPVDFRLLAATNRDLKEESANNRFRLDLFYRLNVVSVKTPALSDHPQGHSSFSAILHAEIQQRKRSRGEPHHA